MRVFESTTTRSHSLKQQHSTLAHSQIASSRHIEHARGVWPRDSDSERVCELIALCTSGDDHACDALVSEPTTARMVHCGSMASASR